MSEPQEDDWVTEAAGRIFGFSVEAYHRRNVPEWGIVEIAKIIREEFLASTQSTEGRDPKEPRQEEGHVDKKALLKDRGWREREKP